MTLQQEHSQCPLVEMDSITSLFIVYRYVVQLEHSQCPLVEMDTITSLFIVNRYDSTTGTFTVPPGGEFYYFSANLRVHGDIAVYFNIELNGELMCTIYSDLTESPSTDSEITSCSAVTYAVEGIH